MATLCVMLEESNRDLKPPPALKGFHYVQMRLDDMKFSDEEINQYATALGLMLLSAVRESNG